MAPGAIVSPTVNVQVPATAPFGAMVTNTAQVGDDGASGPDGNPANNLGERRPAGLRRLDTDRTISGGAAPGAGRRARSSRSPASPGATPATRRPHRHVSWGDGRAPRRHASADERHDGRVGAVTSMLEDGTYTVEICVRDSTARTGCTDRLRTIVRIRLPAVIEPGAVSSRSWIEEEWEGADPSACGPCRRRTARLPVGQQPAVGLLQSAAGDRLVARRDHPGRIGRQLGRRLHRLRARLRGRRYLECRTASSCCRLEAGRTRHAPSAVSPSRGPRHRRPCLAHSSSPDTGWTSSSSPAPRPSAHRLADGREYRFRFEIVADRLRIWVDDVCSSISRSPSRQGSSASTTTRSRPCAIAASHRAAAALRGRDVRARGAVHRCRRPRPPPRHRRLGRRRERRSRRRRRRRFRRRRGEPRLPRRWRLPDRDLRRGRRRGLRLRSVPAPRSQPAASGHGGGRPDGYAGLEERFALATFTDPGSARQPPGDGRLGRWQPARAGRGGRGRRRRQSSLRVTPTRSPASYPVTVCVTDDDGASACAGLRSASALLRRPCVRRRPRTVFDRDGDGQPSPGDDIVYRIELFNDGATPAPRACAWSIRCRPTRRWSRARSPGGRSSRHQRGSRRRRARPDRARQRRSSSSSR